MDQTLRVIIFIIGANSCAGSVMCHPEGFCLLCSFEEINGPVCSVTLAGGNLRYLRLLLGKALPEEVENGPADIITVPPIHC
jgi:hypothetical protein